jgi:hypothetical protein
LRLLASPIPESAFMHDWWMALVAAARGRIEAVPEATVLYRQHERNVIGSGRRTLWDLPELLAGGRMRRYYGRTQDQAAAFVARHGDALDPVVRDIVTRYAGLRHDGSLGERVRLLRAGVRDVGFPENVGFLLFG